MIKAFDRQKDANSPKHSSENILRSILRFCQCDIAIVALPGKSVIFSLEGVPMDLRIGFLLG